MNRIKEFIFSRFSANGRMRIQLTEANRVSKEFPQSDYAKTFFQLILKKYLFGSKSVRYESLIQHAWKKTEIDFNREDIVIDNIFFKNDLAFKSEFADIYLSSDMKINDFITENQKVAREILKILSVEGSYERNFVRLKEGDIVVDAGANMGLFSLYATMKDVAQIYAFEPQKEAIKLLKENIYINKLEDKIKIEPLGLSDSNEVINLNYSGDGHSSGSIIMHENKMGSELIECVTIDSWVKQNKIERIDFIKADIEGAERNMLLGATETLQKLQPRLAICIYHLPDDYEVITSIIKAANPAYRIERTSHKIFAYVP